MTPEEAKAKHAQDQAWASLREWKSDIERIANGGLRFTEYDNRCVIKVFKLVLGEIYYKETDYDAT